MKYVAFLLSQMLQTASLSDAAATLQNAPARMQAEALLALDPTLLHKLLAGIPRQVFRRLLFCKWHWYGVRNRFANI